LEIKRLQRSLRGVYPEELEGLAMTKKDCDTVSKAGIQVLIPRFIEIFLENLSVQKPDIPPLRKGGYSGFFE
jgi:hypothetical protein